MPDIYYTRQGDMLTITEAAGNGTTVTVREYKVQGDRLIAHGTWSARNVRYRSGNPVTEEICEYQNGLLNGRRWLRVEKKEDGGWSLPCMDQRWKNGKPDGLWQIAASLNEKDRPGEVEFQNGIEARRSQYGSSKYSDKLLLWQWTKGKLTYKAEWVARPPSELLQPEFYLNPQYAPDIAPQQLSLLWVQRNIRMVPAKSADSRQ